MQRHTISPGAIIGSFNNINLAISGPIAGIRKPQGGPCTATVGGMKDVKDEQAVVVGIVGLDANGVASAGGVGIACIDFDNGGVVGRIREIGPDCVCPLEVATDISPLSHY